MLNFIAWGKHSDSSSWLGPASRGTTDQFSAENGPEIANLTLQWQQKVEQLELTEESSSSSPILYAAISPAGRQAIRSTLPLPLDSTVAAGVLGSGNYYQSALACSSDNKFRQSLTPEAKIECVDNSGLEFVRDKLQHVRELEALQSSDQGISSNFSDLLQSCTSSIQLERRAGSSSLPGSTITLTELSRYFDMPITQASKKLKVGLTVLKKRCREFGIPRWPHRKLKSLDSLIHNMQEVAKGSDQGGVLMSTVKDELRELENQKTWMQEKPGMDLTDRTKRLRQACFKNNYKRRRRRQQHQHQDQDQHQQQQQHQQQHRHQHQHQHQQYQHHQLQHYVSEELQLHIFTESPCSSWGSL
ncbi:hypothetical protein O6H91_03G054400 [Diphasiastrum complanatum]|uniref:Uncharacterized protein n=1 Tax=Diphasiastrum complanatum TaxID=34168 RepID=A0ACC2E687_DIPCM|nr:hypothetical protein O6H91_03G054400 [Diphasiastrum complanatum]